MELIEAVGKRLDNLLKERNMTRKELAEKSGVSLSTINNLLKARTKDVLIPTMLKIVHAFDMTFNTFFKDYLFSRKNIDSK